MRVSCLKWRRCLPVASKLRSRIEVRTSADRGWRGVHIQEAGTIATSVGSATNPPIIRKCSCAGRMLNALRHSTPGRCAPTLLLSTSRASRPYSLPGCSRGDCATPLRAFHAVVRMPRNMHSPDSRSSSLDTDGDRDEHARADWPVSKDAMATARTFLREWYAVPALA